MRRVELGMLIIAAFMIAWLCILPVGAILSYTDERADTDSEIGTSSDDSQGVMTAYGTPSERMIPQSSGAEGGPQIVRISSALATKISTLKTDEKVRVAIWTKEPDAQSVIRSLRTSQSGPEVQGLAKEKTQSQIPPATGKNQVSELLREKEMSIIYESPYAPLIFAEVSASEIHDLSSFGDIISLDLESSDCQPLLDSAVPSMLVPPIWASVKSPAKVAVVENDKIATVNPYLPTVTAFKPLEPAGDHATRMAGVIASKHPIYQGMAYKTPVLLSANAGSFYEADLVAASDWAIANGANVLSCSFGGAGEGTTLARYYDTIVRKKRVTVVAGTGNDPTKPVAYPANAFNVIAAGSFDDGDTGWIWSDDKISTVTSYINPSDGREKPEVVAVGSGGPSGIMTTIRDSPWIGNGYVGSSFSTAAVSGEAALLIGKNPTLKLWPETVKAIIMATADHNIEGSSTLSDKDGAGAINAQEAIRSASTNGRWGTGILTYGPNILGWYYRTLSLSQGQRVRMVIVWDSRCDNYLSGECGLNADLDLHLERNVGGNNWVREDNRVGYSGSHTNNFEILEFNVPQTGKYRIFITPVSWKDLSYSEYLGMGTYIR